MTSRHRATDFVRARTHILTSLDPNAPLDDLEPVHELVEGLASWRWAKAPISSPSSVRRASN